MKRPSISFNKDAVLDFLLRHVEKFVATAVGLAALWFAWSGLNAWRFESVRPDQVPAAIDDGAKRAETHINAVAELPGDLLPAHASLTKEIDAWRNAKPVEARGLAILDKPLFEDLARRTKPTVLPLEDLRAVAGVAVLPVKPAVAPGAAAEGRATRPPRGGRPPQPEPLEQPGLEQPAQPESQPGRVVPYVIVTGLIPVAKQQAEFDRTFAEVGFRDAKLDTPVWADFELERSTAGGKEEAWQKLDMAAVLKLRIAQWAAAEPNRVPPDFLIAAAQDGRERKVSPFGFCGLLPTRIDEPWGAEQFHPLVLEAVRAEIARQQSAGGQPGVQQPAAPDFVEGGAEAPGGMPVGFDPLLANEAGGIPPGGPEFMGLPENQGLPQRMFRFIDTSVEPGKSYRYRVKLTIRNPNYGLDAQYVAEPGLATDPLLPGPPGEATAAVRVPDPVAMLAGPLDADDVKRLKLKPGMFELLVMAPSQKTGNYSLRSVVTEVGGVANVDEAFNKPNEQRCKGEKILTERVLLDVLGQQADATALAPARPGRPAKQQAAGPAEPLEMIFMKRDGSLEFVSAAESAARVGRYRDTLYPPEVAQPPGGPGFGEGLMPLEVNPFSPRQPR